MTAQAKFYEKKASVCIQIVGLGVPKQATVAEKSDPWVPRNHHTGKDQSVGGLVSRLPISRPLHPFLEYYYIRILIPKLIMTANQLVVGDSDEIGKSNQKVDRQSVFH